MPQGKHDLLKALEALLRFVHAARTWAVEGWATSIDESGSLIDDGFGCRTGWIGPHRRCVIAQQRRVLPDPIRGAVVVLHVVLPKGEARKPLEFWRAVADEIRLLAQVEVGVERRVDVGILPRVALLVVAKSREVVVQLADVAPSGGLDDASPPPAATLHVAMHGPAGGVDLVGVRASLRPAALVGEAALVLPAVGVAVGGVNAVVHGLQVVGRELRNLRVPCRAALLRVIPPRQRVARHGPRRAEQRRRSPRPAGHGPGAHRHAGVLGALHVPLREVARVLAVVLPHLPARGRHGVGGQAAAAAVVVLVAHVVLDGLAEALRQEQRDVGEGLLHGVAQQEVLAAQALLHHELVGLHHVRPPVHGGLLPAASRLLGHQDVLVHDALREVAVQRLQHLRQQLRVVGGRRRQQQAHRRSGGCDARPELHGVGLDPNERTYVCICINARFVSFLLLSTRCLSWMLLLDAARG